jgi:hypothetical protein
MDLRRAARAARRDLRRAVPRSRLGNRTVADASRDPTAILEPQGECGRWRARMRGRATHSRSPAYLGSGDAFERAMVRLADG